MHILHSGSPSHQLLNLGNLLRAVGISVDMVDVARGPISRETCADLSRPGLVVDAASLGKVVGASDSVRNYIATRTQSTILLFVSDAAKDTRRLIYEVTDGAVEGIRRSSGETARFTQTTNSAAHELAGYCFPRSSKPALQIVGNGISDILQIGNEPVFGVIDKYTESTLLVWSTLSVFDVTRRLSSELEFEYAVDEYIPGIVFARAAAGSFAWHNPSANASLIIDDPLLQPRYGHIDFRHLLESARAHSYSVTLAFIPWNHWRTRKRNTALFKDYSDVFSVCVHGNDHTAAEFEVGSYEELKHRAVQAIERMNKHRNRTGIDYAPVMVCPQERYSVEALRAIAASGRFLAVANSRLIPNVPEAIGRVTGADLLQPAMDAWSPSALLKRHYPAEGIEKIALTLFLGRPVILSEHHRYFSTGTDRIEEMVQELNRLRPDLTWKPLGEIVRKLRWQRQIGKDSWQVRFFSDEYLLEPVAIETVNYQLERRVLDAPMITAVSSHGRNLDFKQEDGQIKFAIRTSKPVGVQVSRRIGQAARVPAAKHRDHVKVALRRAFSEIRDRTLASGDRAINLMRPLLRSKAQGLGDKKDR